MAEVEIIKRPDNDGGKYTKKIGQSIKKSAWMTFFESLALMALGIFLIIWPNTVIRVIAYALGAFLVVNGGFRIINYLMEKGQKDYFNSQLLIGVILALAGAAIIIMGEGIAGAFRIVVGIWIIYEALVKINSTIKLHSAGVSAWRYTLLVALTMLLLGIFVAFNSGAVVTLVGWMMIISGVIGIVGDVVFMQYLGALVEKFSK